MVRSLLHSSFPADAIYAGPATSVVSEVIGTVNFVMGRVVAIGRDGVERVLKKGMQLHQGDELQTDGRGFIRATMVDGTRFNLGFSRHNR